MTDRPIAPRDIVKLKSGGPKMTVGQIVGTEGKVAVCHWFDKSDKAREKSFFVADLELAK